MGGTNVTTLTFEGRVAMITGARTFAGGELIAQLENDPRYRRVLALDIRRPDYELSSAEFIAVDLTSPSAEDELADIALDAGVDTVVHTAFLSHPTHAVTWAHELEDVGTMNVLGACAAASPSRVLMTSTTLLYGASPDNPVVITEDQPLDRRGKPAFLADKISAEAQLAQFAEAHPSVAVSSLRFAPILGRRVRTFITELLCRPVVAKLAGFDPLIQGIHENDAIRALKLAVDAGPRGPLNLVGRGVIRYSTLLALLGTFPVSLPRFVWRPLARAMWATQLSPAPPELLDYLRFLCVADGSRAAEAIGFKPQFHVRDAAAEMFGDLDAEASLFSRAFG